MILYLCVLIVFSLRRELLKLSWSMNPSPRAFCHNSAVDVVSEALSMHVAPPAIQIVVVPIGVTVLLGLCNPPLMNRRRQLERG
jgi:hypothetical protein